MFGRRTRRYTEYRGAYRLLTKVGDRLFRLPFRRGVSEPYAALVRSFLEKVAQDWPDQSDQDGRFQLEPSTLRNDPVSNRITLMSLNQLRLMS